jgi:Ca2+-binding EF-hand superfamily protein
MDDMKCVLGCLMVNETKTLTDGDAEQHPATLSNIEELFCAIDVEKAGKIDFEGFRKFYETILLSGTTTIKLDAL